MESISHLRELLTRVLSHSDAHVDEHELFNELMIQKSQLCRLFDIGPRSLQEQKEIESGKILINGRQVALNSDFAKQVIFLSQQLDCSERYVAELLHSVMSENPNVGAESSIDLTIASFHLRRRHLVDTLRYLLEATEAAEFRESSSTYSRTSKYVRAELIPGEKEVSLAHRIFKQIELMDNAIGRADVARRSAMSNTVAASGQGTLSLGYDVLNARYDSLVYERRYLAVCLCSISSLGCLSAEEIRLVTDWLSNNSNHPMVYYFLTAVLLAFDPVDPQSKIGVLRQGLASDSSIITFMTKKLSPSADWKEQGLKAVILLKWTMFLTESRHQNSNLEHRNGFKTEELETQVWNAVQGDAFTYLTLAVARIQRKRGIHVSVSLDIPQQDQEQRENLPDDFWQIMLFELETLVRSLITHASSELRKIKQRQEDLVLASSHDRTRGTSRFTSSVTPGSEKQNPAPRHDIAILYTFIGMLYSALPEERALQFWGSSSQDDVSRITYLEYVESTVGRLPAFLQWAVWSTSIKDLTMLTALYEMLSGLSKGQQCSELSYNFMARGGGEVLPGSMLSASGGPSVSWTVIFSLLESWAASAMAPRGNPPQQAFNTSGVSLRQFTPASQPPLQQIVIGPKDVLLAQAFLHLLSNVVTYSVAVRTTVAGHAHFRAIPTLLSLIPLSIPLELKGALFETVSAFCEPGAGASGVEICKGVWVLMERLEVINVRVSANGGFLAASKGVEVELEQIEAVHGRYPATIPFLHLLGTLIHTPKGIPLKGRVTDVEPNNTIPESLGQPYRLPGIGPFTSFIIDNVFANIPNREYANPSDRWQTNDLCLRYIEHSLASFNLGSLVASPQDIHSKQVLIPLLVHPGYDVMKRLLSNTPLQQSILSYIVEGVEGFEKDFADEEPFFRNTIVRVLRIVHRALEIQDIFLDVFVPLLADIGNAAFAGTAHPRSYYIRFDQALSFGPKFVPALAAYMAYPTHPELVLMSIKVITLLSTSMSFSTLVSLIERSDDSERILGGFRRILSVESVEDVAEAEELAEQMTGAGARNMEAGSDLLEQAIRLAALDLLIQETDPSRPYPNVSHFLLFGNTNKEIQDPHALGAHQTCIHVLLDRVNAGVPRGSNRSSRERHSHLVALFVSQPGLAERCYRVIYQLCIHPRTSDFTSRYLRTRENFFVRQLAFVPSKTPEIQQEPHIKVLYNDSSRVTTTVAALSSFIRLRSYIFELVALELHILTNRGQSKDVLEILQILFENDAGYNDEDFPTFREVGQSYIRIIDFLQSLIFDWEDSLIVEPMQLHFLGELNLHSCIRKDATGCDVVDRTALLRLLSTGKRTLHAQGSIATATHVEQLSKETSYILESCAVENHRRKVASALVIGFEAWKRLLDTALTKCFDRLPHEHRENMLFDLLHVLPGAIKSTNEDSTAILLSETILSSITKLREDRGHQVILQSVGRDAGSGSLPAERLYAVLRDVVDGIVNSNHVELVRGNLYAALINFIHLVASHEAPNVTSTPSSSLSLITASSVRDNGYSSFNQSLVPTNVPNSNASLVPGSLAILKPAMERLAATVSRDAIDGTEVWKTIAFMLLDALVQLSGQEKHHIILSALNRHGILTNFVKGIKESDEMLQFILKPDPDDLNPLYVYEAKMSLFIRMAQTRLGAERLLEAQIIPILAQCDYIEARPEYDQSFMDRDSFLPSAIHRYHQLFMPALQIVDGILAVLGTKHTTAVNQALDFLSGHCSTIVILLKNEWDRLTLALLEEIHLIVTLCCNVLPSVPKSELLSPNSGFGSIHAAIFSLSARILGRVDSYSRIAPQTDIELADASVHTFGFGFKTKFDVMVQKKDRLLRKSLAAYIGVASEFTEPEISLVLSPITAAPRHEDGGSHFSATVPTIGDALEALEGLCNDLSETLKQITDITAELANRSHIGIDNIEEVFQDVHPSLLLSLDVDQKRSLICQELERVKEDTQKQARTVLDTTEMLLLLVWRHLDYYAEPRHMNNPPSKASLANAMRLLATSDTHTFKTEVGTRLAPTLQRLSALDIDQETIGKDWQANQAYIEIMCRRLRDSAGLHDEMDLQEQEY